MLRPKPVSPKVVPVVLRTSQSQRHPDYEPGPRMSVAECLCPGSNRENDDLAREQAELAEKRYP